jgi:hypothetical protein
MTHGRRKSLSVALALALVSHSFLSFAQPAAAPEDATPSDDARARADALFREGRELIAAGKTAEACAKFEQSQAAEPSPGTLLNLAACRLREGNLVRARDEFRRAAALAVEHPDAERRAAWTEAASKELRALEPRIPHLRWSLESSVPVTVLLDGVELAQPLPQAGTPVNPGLHRVEARAPDRTPFLLEFRAGEGQTIAVQIPELAAASRTPFPTKTQAQANDSPAQDGDSPSIAPYVAFGASALFVGGAVATGIVALNAEAELEEKCTEPDPQHSGGFRCAPSLESTKDRAKTFGVVTDVLLVGALVSAGVGVYFLVSEPASAPTRVGARCGRAGCSLDLRQSF